MRILLRQFVRENIEFVNLRSLFKQIAGLHLSHECFRYFAFEMRIRPASSSNVSKMANAPGPS
jgi:hypothetical protein